MAITVVNSTFSNSTTPTIPATTAGNCLVVLIGCGGSSATLSGITLGGSADNFGQLIAPVVNAAQFEIFTWADPNCAGGQTAISLSGSGLAVGVTSGLGGVAIYEVSGLATTLGALLDKSSVGTGSVTAYSSGATATTANANELWVGSAGSSGTISTGPGAPWNNHLNPNTFMTGYQVASSTGAATYSGNVGSGSWAANVVTLNGSGGGGGSSPQSPLVGMGGWIL